MGTEKDQDQDRDQDRDQDQDQDKDRDQDQDRDHNLDQDRDQDRVQIGSRATTAQHAGEKQREAMRSRTVKHSAAMQTENWL